jgi:hypothetical protein
LRCQIIAIACFASGNKVKILKAANQLLGERMHMKKLKEIALSIALIAIILSSVQFAAAATLGQHRVWYDLNGNGILDAGEPGASGVTVELYYCNGTFVSSTTTNADGYYIFLYLPVGSYYEKVLAPSGYTFTLKDQGTDNLVDSDVDQVTGETDCINLPTEDSVICSVKAGLVCVPTGTGLTPGFWKNNLAVYLGLARGNRGYSDPTGSPTVTKDTMEDFFDSLAGTYDLYQLYRDLCPQLDGTTAAIRDAAANVFNVAAGLPPGPPWA